MDNNVEDAEIELIKGLANCNNKKKAFESGKLAHFFKQSFDY